MEISISFIHLTRPLCASLDSDSDTDLKKEFVELFQGFLIFQVYMKWIVVTINNKSIAYLCYIYSRRIIGVTKGDSCSTVVRTTDSICCLLATGEYSLSVCWGALGCSLSLVNRFLIWPELYFKMFAW